MQHWDAVFDERHVLRRERNFDAKFLRVRPAAEKHLRGLPMSEFSREIKRDHFIAAGRATLVSASLQESTEVFGAAQSRGYHQTRYVSIIFDVIAERFGRQ